MPILFASEGSEVKVSKIGGSPEIKQHLTEMGFISGTPVTIISKIPTGIIVKVKNSRIAIDTSMASKIMV